jgi:anti-sigma B factor antagonist
MPTITFRIVEDVAVIDVSGRIPITESPLKQVVDSLLKEGRRTFLINFSDIPYIGSWTVSQLLSAWTAIQSFGGSLSIVASGESVCRVFETTKLDSVFSIYATEAEALSDLSITTPKQRNQTAGT